jgi:hypothetical protein
MTRSSKSAALTKLPVIDESRREFGYARSKCGCEKCSVYCRFAPGMVIPQDLALLGPLARGETALIAWAMEHLQVSTGPMGFQVTGADGVRVKYPTLVPARGPDGLACHWLMEDGRCAVHERAPFGCAFFDCRLDGGDALERKSRACEAMAESWRAEDATPGHPNGLYARVCKALAAAGRIAPDPAVSRSRMQKVAMAEAKGRGTRQSKPRRNDPCPCGSGRKFKHCCIGTSGIESQ